MSTTYRIGPAVILVADNFSDPVSSWTEVARTSGGVSVDMDTVEVAQQRINQYSAPVSEAYLAPKGMMAKFSIPDFDIAQMVEFMPGAVQVTSGTREALQITSRMAKLSGKSVAIVPLSQYSDDKMFLGTAGCIYFEDCFFTIGEMKAGNAPDGDLMTYEVTATRMSGATGVGYPEFGAANLNPIHSN